MKLLWLFFLFPAIQYYDYSYAFDEFISAMVLRACHNFKFNLHLNITCGKNPCDKGPSANFLNCRQTFHAKVYLQQGYRDMDHFGKLVNFGRPMNHASWNIKEGFEGILNVSTTTDDYYPLKHVALVIEHNCGKSLLGCEFTRWQYLIRPDLSYPILTENNTDGPPIFEEFYEEFCHKDQECVEKSKSDLNPNDYKNRYCYVSNSSDNFKDRLNTDFWKTVKCNKYDFGSEKLDWSKRKCSASKAPLILPFNKNIDLLEEIILMNQNAKRYGNNCTSSFKYLKPTWVPNDPATFCPQPNKCIRLTAEEETRDSIEVIDCEHCVGRTPPYTNCFWTNPVKVGRRWCNTVYQRNNLLNSTLKQHAVKRVHCGFSPFLNKTTLDNSDYRPECCLKIFKRDCK